jgi:hypothetical protein
VEQNTAKPTFKKSGAKHRKTNFLKSGAKHRHPLFF